MCPSTMQRKAAPPVREEVKLSSSPLNMLTSVLSWDV